MADFEYQELENSSIRLNAHKSENCLYDVCTMHKRTDHSMRRYPQFWRSDRKIMERVCSHGIGHPDPDDHKIITGSDDGEHGCDGCCIRFATEEEYADSRKYGE